MLNMIKTMIQEHQEQVMAESTDLFLENHGGLQMDPETLILGEGTDDVQPNFDGIDDSTSEDDNEGDITEGNEPDDNNPDDDHESDDDHHEEEEPEQTPEEKQDDDTPNDGEGNPVLPSNNGDDEKDADDDSLVNASIGDDLPTPVGTQTGEPVNPDNDLLSTEIDLTSNTMRDTLPTPPKGASDALIGDDDQPMSPENNGSSEVIDTDTDEVKENPILGQLANMINNAHGDSIRVDQLKELFHESVISGGNIEDEPMLEAMTIGDPAPDDQKSATAVDANTGDDGAAGADNSGASDATADGIDQTPTDNTVTAAVKDKVAESEEPIEPTPEEGASASGGGGSQVKDNLLKKLANLSKSIEDTKKEIIDSL